MTRDDQRPLLRKEDKRLLTGAGQFVDDIHLDRMLHAAFVRSDQPHAEIVSIDTHEAIKAGAYAVLTGKDLPFIDKELFIRYWHPSIRRAPPRFLATDKVRFAGEPVAIVIASDRYQAEDLAALVNVKYAPLPALSSTASALASNAPQIHGAWPGNIAAHYTHSFGEPPKALMEAPRTIRRRFHFGRQAATPLETRGCVANYNNSTDFLTVWASTQTHYAVRHNLAFLLAIPETQVQVIAEDVGGGFGAKSRPYLEEIVVAHASRVLGRPVKWIEDRLEHFHATTHSRDIESELEVAFDQSGRLLSLKGRLVVDVGAYVFTSGIITAEVAASHSAGPYKIAHVAIEVVCVGTNKTPLATYRGAGQPEATFPLESIIDQIASELGLSPIAVRQINLIRPEDMPYNPRVSYGGPDCRIESGDFPKMLTKAVQVSGYDEKVSSLKSSRSAWGLACGVESTGLINYESAQVKVDASGSVLVYSGLTSHGQGQATTLGLTCARTLGVSVDNVSVRLGDTNLLAFGRGAFASRGAVVGANAVHGAALKVRKKAIEGAAQLLQCSPTSLKLEDGQFVRIDGADTSVSLADVAAAVQPGGSLYTGETCLESTYIHDTKNLLTFALSVHAAKVTVDLRTGIYKVDHYVVVHDAGVMLSEKIVEGQIVGGVVDGIGGAMLSELLYDDDCNLVTATLADYLVANARDCPRIRLSHIETIPTTNPLGVRGVGEGGIIPASAAIVSALAKAIGAGSNQRKEFLSHVPLKPEAVFKAIRSLSI